MYIYIFTTVVLGEKIKSFLFSLPFFGRENKELFFHDFWGGEKILKILFIFTSIFGGRENKTIDRYTCTDRQTDTYIHTYIHTYSSFSSPPPRKKMIVKIKFLYFLSPKWS